MPATPSDQVDTIVVGGGPAGSVAALLLATAGRQVVVLERAPIDRATLGAGILAAERSGGALLHGAA